MGSDAAWNEFGFFSGSSRVKVPVDTRKSVSSVHSSGEPVHQCTRSGWVSSAISVTQDRMPSWVVGALCWVVSAVMLTGFLSRVRVRDPGPRP